MFKKVCAGIFLSGSILLSAFGNSAVVAAPPPVMVCNNFSREDGFSRVVVECGGEILEDLNDRQIGYLDGLNSEVRYMLFSNPEVWRKISDDQVAHLRKFGNDWRAASDYIKSLEKAGYEDSSSFFDKVLNWIFG